MKIHHLLLALSLSAPLQAALLYDQSPPNPNAIDITNYRVADNFILTQNSTLNTIDFWYQAQFEDDLNSVTWALYTDASQSVGNLIATATATPVTSVDSNAFLATFSLGSITLAAGNYWLELHSGSTLTDGSGFSVYWSATNENPSAHARFQPSGVPNITSDSPGFQQMAFRVQGTTRGVELDDAELPEPATCLSLGIGLLAISVWRRIR
ncbi:PEP-CTERM sorting domain-containing protein [Bryobacter aggregatus]|uniref:PEP-CTERM sorting domain-containing protein n=1 Tax=Bryobacter aggregatus TaxID=360054 RepID=UPI0004E2502F|nr:PEP-CTERM sorting domain-containing protein [Bryobacter aggregatus]